MPEEIESPVDKLSEELHEAALDAKENWLKGSALLAALLAVMAASAGLESAHYANTALFDQMQASDQWSYYQAKSIKTMLMDNTLLTQHRHLNRKNRADIEAQINRYRDEQEQIKAEAERLTQASKAHLEKHESFSRTVTLSQIAIAIVAIAVLTRLRWFILVSVGLGVVACLFLVQALVRS